MNAAPLDPVLIDSILERGERFADLEGATPGECLVLVHLAHVRMDAGRPAGEVAPLAERAANPNFVGELGPASVSVLHAGIVLRQAERLDVALRLLDAAVSAAQKQGSLRGFVIASMFRSAVLPAPAPSAGQRQTRGLRSQRPQTRQRFSYPRSPVSSTR